MLPTFHEDDHRCHYKDKKLKSAGRIKEAGFTISFVLLYDGCRSTFRNVVFYNKRCWKMENALHCRTHSVVKRQSLRVRDNSDVTGSKEAVHWTGARIKVPLLIYSLKFANILIFGRHQSLYGHALSAVLSNSVLHACLLLDICVL